MSEAFLGEVRMFAFDYAPTGWAACDGQLLGVAQNQALFSLLGVTFGGNGQTTFGLPDLRGRVAVHAAAPYQTGQQGGETAHVLVGPEMPFPHTHAAQATSGPAASNVPQGAVLANVGLNAYAPQNPPQPIAPDSIGSIGGQPHENMAPYQTVQFCIALVGLYPPRN